MSSQIRSGYVEQVEIYFFENVQRGMSIDAALDYARSRVSDGLDLNHDDVRDLPDEAVDKVWRAQKLKELEQAMAEVDNYDFSTIVAKAKDNAAVYATTPGYELRRKNITAVILSAGSVLEQVEDYLKSIEKNNLLCSEYPEHLESIRNLRVSLNAFIISIPKTDDVIELHEVQEVATRWDSIKALVLKDIENRTSDEAIAEKVLPLGVILGCGTIGALLGGSLGFGAGAFVGKLVLGDKKPGAVADKIEDALKSRDD